MARSQETSCTHPIHPWLPLPTNASNPCLRRRHHRPRRPPPPTTGVASKDIIIDSSTDIWVRLYLPKPSDSDQPKLPLLVYSTAVLSSSTPPPPQSIMPTSPPSLPPPAPSSSPSSFPSTTFRRLR
ncbi:hypothetical protein QJS10_CPA05g02158 [Acorus calamus]|uniref:Uncharacterized protein n=1 Tax=Acorus calamus TaxID=4465 RepID=A0AAV9ETX7_ACOCL|nr:hypothetical protein QJS10_CPA05g02158 [Acorus calamus]